MGVMRTNERTNKERTKMIMAEKKTTNGTMRLVMAMDDGVVEFVVVHQRVQVNFGQNQSEAWAWYNATDGV